jgi:membrane-associated protease RseP (regulator of RpoE activity)
MTDFYQSFRNEIAAGGAIDDGEESSTPQGRIVGVIMLAALVVLAFKSPWTFVFVVGLLVSVFLHEVGHFVTARRTGMKATQFFMGFGPRVFSFRRGETEYGLRALPLGAFVRIIGMNNLDEVDEADEPRAYRSKSHPRRLLVITAGSLMHMVIAFTLFFGVYVFHGGSYRNGQAMVLNTLNPSPAFTAGITPGDEIISIDGVEVGSYDSIVKRIARHAPGDTMEVSFLHNGDLKTVNVTLVENPSVKGRGFLGVFADDWGYKHLDPVTAVARSVGDIGSNARDGFTGMFTVLNPLNSWQQVTDKNAPVDKRPTTVVGISQVGGQVGRDFGLAGVMRLLAYVNVFVGMFNMLPLLPFDGGHAAIATYERIRSRKGRVYRADIGKMVPVATAVVGLLLILFVTGLYLDIARPIG